MVLLRRVCAKDPFLQALYGRYYLVTMGSSSLMSYVSGKTIPPRYRVRGLRVWCREGKQPSRKA